MTLYLLRHGIAEDSAPGGDAERRLTRQGTFQVAMIAKGLRKIGIQFDRVIASPLVRARETSEVLTRITEFAGTIETDSRLLPESRFEEVSDLIAECADSDSVLFTGHQPALGQIVGGLISTGELDLEVTPATIRAISIHRFRPRARGTLLWTLTPTIIEALTG
jgi:phosphohistidine phosphatase